MSMKVGGAPSAHDINVALLARDKRVKGDKLSGREKKALEAFRDLYKGASQIAADPGLCSAVEGALAAQGPAATQVPNNPLLSQHLQKLLAKGSATDTEVAQITTLAARLSEDEDDAISATLARLALKGGVSEPALAQIDAYLQAERSQRSSFVRSKKLASGLVKGGLILAATLAAPLLAWFTPLGGLLAGLGGGAAAAAQLGVFAGGLGAGATLGTVIGNRVGRGADQYGVRD